jgi:hypothetical protein
MLNHSNIIDYIFDAKINLDTLYNISNGKKIVFRILKNIALFFHINIFLE